MGNTPTNPYALAQGGMTLRDWFAGQAISQSFNTEWADKDVAKYAYAIADAMLAERNK